VSRLKETIPYYHLRLSVKPGITGWAQILYEYGDSDESTTKKLEYDLYYLKYMSPLFDLQILFETFKVVIFGAWSPVSQQAQPKADPPLAEAGRTQRKIA